MYLIHSRGGTGAPSYHSSYVEAWPAHSALPERVQHLNFPVVADESKMITG